MSPASRTPDSAPWSDDRGETQVHGSLVEVEGLGVLLVGESGIGKSECVLELVRRGGRLVADDVVRLELRAPDGPVVGRAPETIRDHVAVHGLGILCLAELYGSKAVREVCPVGFVCRLMAWSADTPFERVGLERERHALLGLELPAATLPVQAGGNTATLVELAVLDWRLRERGINAAQRLDERLRAQSPRVRGTGEGA